MFRTAIWTWSPVVARNALDFGKAAIEVDDDGEDEDYLSESDWVLVSSDAAVFARAFSSITASSPPKSGRACGPGRTITAICSRF